MMSFFWSLLGFALVMGLLVFIHEWGHYQVARWCNIQVKVFSIGFGKPLFSKIIGETEYRLSMIPLGGYVKFLDEREGEVAENQQHRAFNRQSVYKRFAVVSAGPFINLLFAWLVFSTIYVVGTTGMKPVFNAAAVDSPLADAGLPENHQAWVIQQVNDRSVASWKQVHHALVSTLMDEQQQALKLEIVPFSVDDPRQPLGVD